MGKSPKQSHFQLHMKSRWRKKIVAWMMLILYMTQPIIVAAEAIADPKAPGKNRPLIESTANNLPIVQIGTPSAAGVSRNLYQQFNVDPYGLILNNSRKITKTQLAGYVAANPYLGNGPAARVILNEVTSNNPSYLRGYIEVAGQKAEVIIANPSGIYGDGFGFINTSRAVLTTGTPIFGGSENLDAFRVTGGQIAIQGAGLDATNLDQVDLISRSVAINAGLWTKKLNVVAGSNTVDYNTLHTETISSDSNKPQVAIDIGQLGGMYAQKIYLVGTENGVGVNSAGTIVAQAGDITITTAGKVLLTGNTSATGNIQVAAGDDISNQNTVYAQGHTNIIAAGSLGNSGVIVAGQNTSISAQSVNSTGAIGAGVQNDGTIGMAGHLTINTSGTVIAQGENVAAESLTINGTAIDLVNSKNYAGTDISLKATTGDIDHNGAAMQVGGELNATAQGAIRNDTGTITAQRLALTANVISNRSGTLSQIGQDTTNITATTSIDNTAGIVATNGESLHINASSLINSQGQIQHAGNGTLSVKISNDIKSDKGKMLTNGQLYLTANNVNNTQGAIASSGDRISITAHGNITNEQGSIEANKGLTVTAQSLNNQGGRLISLDGSGIKISAAQNIQNQSGTIGGNGRVDITAQNISNQSGKITAGDNLTIVATKGIDADITASNMSNSGMIVSGGDLSVTSGGETVLSGSITANGNIKINSQGAFANYSTLYGQGNVNINTPSILENTGALMAGQNSTINAESVYSIGTLAAGIQKNGTLGNSGDLTINVSGNVSARGQNKAAGNLVINASTVDFKGANTYVGGNFSLAPTIGDIDNSSGTMQVGGVLNFTAKGTIRNDNGSISGGKMTLAANAISNRNGTLSQTGQGDTIITATTNIDNTAGTIITNAKSLSMQTGLLINSQGNIQHAGNGAMIVQTTNDIQNNNGKIASNGQISLTATNVDNMQGTILGKGIDLITKNILNNTQGSIASSGDAMYINSQGNIANERGSIEANKGLEIIAHSIDNQKGRLVSLDTSGLQVSAATEVQNQSGLIGGNGDINLLAPSFSNAQGQVIAQGSIQGDVAQNINNTNGKIVAQQNVTLGQKGTNINNTLQGSISAGGDIAITANIIDNTNGNMAANQDIAITAGNMTAGGNALAGQDLNIAVTNDFIHGADGDFKANRNINISADSFLSKGSISAVGDVNLNVSHAINETSAKVLGNGNLNILVTSDLTNSGMMAGGITHINAQNIINSGSMVANQLTMGADNLFNTGNKAVITAQQSADFTIKTAFNNTTGANIYSFVANNGVLAIKSQTLSNSGVIASGGNATIVAQTINSSGTLGAGIHNDGTIGTAGDLSLTASNTLTATGSNFAAGTFTATAQDINLTGSKTLASKDIQLTATTGNINNTGAALQANGAVILQAANVLHNDSGSIKGNVINLNAAAISNVRGSITQFGTSDTNIMTSGNVDNISGTILTNGTNLTLKAKALTGSQGNIIHAGTGSMNLVANNMNNNGATIQSNGNIIIAADNVDNTKGKITALQGIRITGSTLTNDRGILAASDGININMQNGLNNQNGTIEAGSTLTINAHSIVNTGGSITGLSASGMTIKANQNIDNTTGTINSNGDINLTAPSLLNANGKILAQGSIMGNISGNIDNTNGTMSAQQDLMIGNASTNTLTNTQGTMTAGGNLAVQAATLNNTGGTLIAAQDLSVITNSNNLGTVTAGRDLNITLNNDFILAADGNMKANRDFNLTATNVTNSGTMAAVANLKITANNVTNNSNANMQGGTGLTIDATGAVTNNGTMGGNTVNISGQTIVNTGSIFGDNLTMTADTISNTGSTATIAATQNVNLFAKTSVENKDDANIYSMGNINIAGSKEYIDKTGSVLNQSATIEADGNIGINAGMLTNKMREYEIKQTVISEKRYDQVGVFQANDYYYSLTGDRNLYLVQGFAGPDFRNSLTGNPIKNYFTAKKLEGGSDKLNTFDPAIGLLAETVTETTVIPKSSIGKIMAGSNMKLRVDTTNNDMSWILTNGTLEEFGTINNTAVGNTRSTTQQLLDLNTNYSVYSLTHSPHDPIPVRVENVIYQKYFDILQPTDPDILGRREYETWSSGGGGAAVLFGYVGKSYYQTTEEQISGGASSLFGGGKQVIIQGGNVNNTIVAASSVSVRTPSNVTSSGQNQGATSAQTTGSTSGQTANLQVNSGYNSVNSSSIPIGDTQTLLPKVQNQSAVSATSNTSSQTVGIQAGNTQTNLSSGQRGVTAVQQTLNNNITIPTSGMFRIRQGSTSPYLVETNSRFTQYSNFASSDYMLKKLGDDPSTMMKRVGDGFYEEKLVQEQVTNLTGRYFLNDYSSADEQYKALMDNGTVYAKQFNLQVGVALTADQMSQLTSNMVWMVEKEVDGQKVLVPQVYLARSGSIILKADGAVIAADNVQIAASGDVNNTGTIKATESVKIQAVNIDNYGGTIDGGKNTQLIAGQNIINFGGSINGDQTQLIAGKDIKNQTVSFTSTLPFMTQTTAGNIASINADHNLVVQAGGDISITGAQVTAGQNVAMTAGGNVTVDSVKEQDRLTVGSYLKDSVSNVVSNITAGNNVNITSMEDATLHGAQVTAGNDLTLLAGGNINVSVVKNEKIKDETVGFGNWKRTRTDDETIIGSTLQGGGQVTVAAVKLSGASSVAASQQDRGKDTIEGSNITSTNGTVTIAGDKNVTVKEVTEKHESLVVTHTEDSGFFSSTTTDTLDHSLVNQAKGSTISGDKVTVVSGNDLTIQGSNVVGTKDVALTAINDINITSAKEIGNDEHYSYTKTSGIFSGGGLGFTIGRKSEKNTTTDKILDEIGSSIGSVNGNVFITAGNQVTSAGTTFVTGKDLSIAGKEVTIDNTINKVDSQSKYEFKQSGLSVSLGGGAVTAVTNAAGDIKRSSEVEDGRLKAIYDYKAAEDIKELGKSKGNLKAGVSVSVSIGSSQMTSEQTSHTETVNISNISAGGNVNVTATAGDINLKGTNMNATGVNLDAAKNINIDGADNKQQTTSNTSSSSWAVGGNIGSGFFANGSKGSGKENEKITTNTGSVITASGAVTLTSGKDTNITGSEVKGDKVVANIGGDLNIASVQDTDNYTAKNQSSGFGLTTQRVDGKPLPAGNFGPINKVTTIGVTGSISKGKTDSTYASVTEQAGIFAGKDGFDITVGKNTDLKGAIIASTATPDKNKLSTDRLTYSDIRNNADYNSSSIGVGYSSNGDLSNNITKGVIPNISVTASGDAGSTTESAISLGKVDVRSNLNQDLSKLSRDTTNAVNALGKIFDKRTVQEQQELAGLFGEEAFKLVGKIGEEKGWAEGSPQKITLHAFIGAVMADLGGGKAFTGGFSAGVNETVQGELARIKDPSVHEWASLVVGSVTAKLVGGNVLTGGATAVSGTKNNFIFTLTEKVIQICEDTPALRALLVRAGVIAEAGVILDEVAASRLVYISRVGAPLAEKEIDEVVTVSRQLDNLAKQASDSLTLAQRVTAWVDGTRMHTNFQNLIKATGNGAIQTEQTFLNGSPANYGTAGAVRLDAVLYNAEGKIISVYDLKTGVAGLSQYRIEEIRQQLGNLAIENVPVFEIRP